MDYSDLNLNNLLQANTSIPAQDPIVTTGYQFVTENERGAITRGFMGTAVIGNAQMGTAVIGTAQIGTLSFNQITGGTAILGGTNNGSGVFLVRDSAGSTRMTATNGSVMMYDDIGNEQFRLVYGDQLLRVNAIDVGGTKPTNSGQIRLYDSGSLLFGQIDVFEAFLNVDTRIGSNLGLTLAGTTALSAPAANSCTLYVDAGGAGGKNRLMAIFDSGVAQVVASEP